MTEIVNSKQYDLEERTLKFTKEVIKFVKSLQRTISNIEIIFISPKKIRMNRR